VAETDATTGASRVSDLEARVNDLEDQWRRALADADNARKRSARDIERARSEERARVAAVWLPIIDHLEMALAHADADPGAIVEGVRRCAITPCRSLPPSASRGTRRWARRSTRAATRP
jgi:molecular chaperone GrpE